MTTTLSHPRSSPSRAGWPLASWLWPLLGREHPAADGERWRHRGQALVMRRGLPRCEAGATPDQAQTEQTFGFKWQKRDTFERPQQLARVRDWLLERYGDVTRAAWFAEHGPSPLVLDAGCGAAMSAIELFAPVLDRIRYLGTDISEAVDVAYARFAEKGMAAGFLQADLMDLPLAEGSVDLIFSEGVLHHTDSTKAALQSLASLLRPGGRFMFYVYRRKGPIRELTDDLIRDRLQALSPEQAWAAMEPLTELGIALGRLDAKIELTRPIDLLGIPAGRIDVQRLFYWHVAKAFYRPDLTFEEMNHINFDWYAPKNSHRQSPEEVRAWCAEVGLEIEREQLEEAGITIIARKSAS